MAETAIVAALISFLVRGAECVTSPAQGLWTVAPMKDIEIAGSVHSSVTGSRGRCGMQCLQRSDCHSIGFQSHTGTCLLYDHMVEHTAVGTAAPDTRYYWRLSQRCPTELSYTQEAGICYRLYEMWVTWDEAQDTCSGDKAALMSITTPEKRSLITRLVQGGKYIWLGATDRAAEGDWRWLTGSRLQGHWAPGQPDNWDNADVLYAGPDGLYDDSSSTKLMQPLCELPMKPLF